MPHHSNVAAPHPAPAAPPPITGSLDAVEEAWFAGLQTGLLEWIVPPKMVLSKSDPVTVRLHGYKDAGNAADTLPGGNGQAPLKVSTQMKVELVSAGGDDLTVTPESEQGVRYVPATGFTDWSWMLTPVHSAKQEKLRLTVEAVFNAEHSRSFVTYSRPFVIEVATAGSVKDYTEKNFGSLAKYWGPGGAGFLAIGGAVAWWRKRRATKAVAAVGTHTSDSAWP